MILTFCGHSDSFFEDELEEKLYKTIEETVKDEPVTFYLGGYGRFDALAKQCCLRFKEHRLHAELVFVSPYYNGSYFENRRFMLEGFDDTLYPLYHEKMAKYAIIKRNEWMIRNSDFLIAYVNYGFGGAAKTLRYAIKRKLPYVNLGRKIF